MVVTRRSLANYEASEARSTDQRNDIGALSQGPEKLQILKRKIENLSYDLLDEWMQDNQYILTGYRPQSNSFRTSFSSIFAIHNETVNIWTHLVPSAVCLAVLVGYMVVWQHLSFVSLLDTISRLYPSATSVDALTICTFIVGASIMFSASWSYHAVSNHSLAISKYWNKLDYIGIICMIITSFVPSVYYGHYCDRDKMVFYFFLLGSFGVLTFFFTILNRFRTPAWRPYRAGMFVLLGLSAIVPVTEAVYTNGLARVKKEMSLYYCITEAILYIVGAYLYACRTPERSHPRRFDIVGASHQIFHCCVVLASIAHAIGVWKAFEYRHTILGGSCPTGS